LRRTTIAITAVVALLAAAVATAQTPPINTYTGSLTFKAGKSGTPAKPIPAGFVELFSASNATTTLDAAPLIDIKLKMYGLRVDSKDFPTCSLAQVTASLGAGCPKGSLVASGPIIAKLGPTNLMGNPSNTINCTPILDVWNAGANKVVELPVIDANHQCGGLQTGAAAPYVVTFTQAGKYLLQDAPLPPDVSTNAGNLGLYNSLTQNDLTWMKLTRKVKGKTVSFLSSVGCLKGKRPYTITFTATNGTATQVSALNAKGAC
jgi:hypothetical protein